MIAGDIEHFNVLAGMSLRIMIADQPPDPFLAQLGTPSSNSYSTAQRVH
jgi:hypothetical protein